MAEVAGRFLTGEAFTTRTALRSVPGAILGETGLPPALNRLYRHWVASGSYSIAQTIVGGPDGKTIIGWSGTVSDPRTGAVTRQFVVPSWDATDRTVKANMAALSRAI
jgi:hypothetical protein